MLNPDDKRKPMRWDLFIVFIAMIAAIVIAFLAVSPDASAHQLKPLNCMHPVIQPETHLDPREIDKKCLDYVIAHNLAHQCAKPRPIIRHVKVKRTWADLTQRKNLTTALNGHRRASTRHLVAMVAAIIQESTAYNNPRGHGTSVGILQLINIHGTVAWRMRIINSTTWFISGARKKDRGQPIGDLAQDVQGSAHPTLYRQWVREAYAIVARFRGPCRR